MLVSSARDDLGASYAQPLKVQNSSRVTHVTAAATPVARAMDDTTPTAYLVPAAASGTGHGFAQKVAGEIKRGGRCRRQPPFLPRAGDTIDATEVKTTDANLSSSLNSRHQTIRHGLGRRDSIRALRHQHRMGHPNPILPQRQIINPSREVLSGGLIIRPAEGEGLEDLGDLGLFEVSSSLAE